MAKGIYIHIPFCKEICTYCDFCKFYLNEKWLKPYFDALEKEIQDRIIEDKIKTIYIGGGTPSSVPLEYLKKLFKVINTFPMDDNYEFTFECNLNDINEELVSFLSKNKVNRVSIGIQSFNQKILNFLGRKGNFIMAKNAINLLKQYGINNINVDLIYAIPKETLFNLKKDLKYIKKLDITHVSTYSLMIQNNTILANKNVMPIKEEKDYLMYKIINKGLKRYGFNHYEVSNFAKETYESKHNLSYWNNEEYYGFGVGASGYVDGVRYNNTKNLNEYIKGNYVLDKEILSEKDIMDYDVILGLRKLSGINVKDFYEKFKVNIQSKYPIDELIKEDLLKYKDGNIFINPSKLYIMNEILVRMI